MLIELDNTFNQDHIVVFDHDTQAGETYIGGETRKNNNEHKYY